MPLDNRDLKQFWQARVDAAHREYERLRLKAAEALENLDCDAGSEEIETLAESQRRETAALTGYMRVLRIYHRVVKGEEPGE